MSNRLQPYYNEWLRSCPEADFPAGAVISREVDIGMGEEELQLRVKRNVTDYVWLTHPTDGNVLDICTVGNDLDVRWRPQAPSTPTSTEGLVSLSVFGEILQAHPDDAVARTGEALSSIALLRPQEYVSAMEQGYALFTGDELAVRALKQNIQDHIAEPTTVREQYRGLYASGEHDNGEPFIADFLRTRIEVNGNSYEDLTLAVEARLTSFTVHVDELNQEVSAKDRIHDTPLYPQLVDESLPVTEDILLRLQLKRLEASAKPLPSLEIPIDEVWDRVDGIMGAVTRVTLDPCGLHRQ